MGAAIECFPGACAVCVPRSRFAPVKKVRFIPSSHLMIIPVLRHLVYALPYLVLVASWCISTRTCAAMHNVLQHMQECYADPHTLGLL
jgi:hypothetical protein